MIEDAPIRQAILERLPPSEPTGERAALLAELLGSIADGAFPGAVVPHVVTGEITYYAVAKSGAAWRALAPLLTAAVGTTTTNFTGRADEPAVDDPWAAWLRGLGLPYVTRFSAGADRSREARALRALVRLRRCLDGAQVPEQALPRSTQQVLGDFQLALAIGDRAAAEQALAYLRANLRVDAMNRCFLEVQLDAAFQDWARLRSRPFFTALCLARRPPAVTAALAEAFYQTAIMPYELADDAQGALEAFRPLVRDAGRLFDVCPPDQSPSATKAFLLAALASGEHDPARIAVLDDQTDRWTEEQAGFYRRLRALVAERPVPTPVPAKEVPTPGTIEAARAALFEALSVQSLDAYRAAVEAVGLLDPEGRRQLLAAPGFRGMWEEIVRYAGGGRVPSSWQEWLALLPDLSLSQAHACAARAPSEWPIDRELTRSDDVGALVQALRHTPDAFASQLEEALPYLVAWVREDVRWPNRDYVSLYRELVDLLLLSSNRTPAARQALADLIDGLLALGLDATSYRSLLDDLREALDAWSDPRSIDWLIEVAEITVVHPCPDIPVRMRLWQQAVSLVGRFAARLDTGARLLLEDLANTLGLPETLVVVPAVPSEPFARAASFAGRTVAIYTLTESVSRRSAALLQRLYPGLRVEICHDRVNSPRLQELARNADVFVISWLAAKHAATDAIRSIRGSNRRILYPSGAGSTSILREIHKYFTTFEL
jgi:hypothetical protein